MTTANIDATVIDNEQMIRTLGADELEAVNGGFGLGDVWDGVTSAASFVATTVENHPIATLALVCGTATGVGAIGEAAGALGDAAWMAYTGATTTSVVAGAVTATGAGAFSGMAVGGVADGIYHVAKAAI
ncbi:hypothetical protein ACLBXM_15795 [Xanthobacteraceae bacterium A53D]